MNILIGVVIFISGIIALIAYSENKLGNKHYNNAVVLEDEKKYDEACYFYALAIFKGVNKKISTEKIKNLWQTHGPFDFSKFLIKSDDKCACSSCDEAGHAITVDLINKIVENI